VSSCSSRSPRGRGTAGPGSRCLGEHRGLAPVAEATVGAGRGPDTATGPGPPATSTERTRGEEADTTGKLNCIVKHPR
jgi:hypothetical protein